MKQALAGAIITKVFKFSFKFKHLNQLSDGVRLTSTCTEHFSNSLKSWLFDNIFMFQFSIPVLNKYTRSGEKEKKSLTLFGVF